ncbi:beta strand repeat-containing protein [Castellaniella sp.]|uniref:beta strand repeat-containing protein n=1 Tax=Castellaniella sp. TaxID=1955812 RepID=UPI00355F65DE
MKKKSRSSARCNPRARTVASASGLALILGLVNAAVAADVSVLIPNTPTSVDDIVLTPNPPISPAPPYLGTAQFQQGIVDASIADSPLFTSSPSGDPGDAVIITTNQLLANALGNSAVQTLDADELASQLEFSVATGQAVRLGAGGQQVKASITNSPATITFSNGTNDVVGNTIHAGATLNQAESAVSDTDFVAGSAGNEGSALATSDHVGDPSYTGVAEADATGAIANAQKARSNINSGASGANVSGSGVRVTADTADLGTGDTITVSGNEVSATFNDNDARNTYEGSGGAFEGSVAVSNLQLDWTAPQHPSPDQGATVSGSGVAVSTNDKAIDGTVTVTGNRIIAQTKGNAVANAADVAAATTVSGNDAAPSVAVAGSVSSHGWNVDVQDATLAIANLQQNYGGVTLQSTITASPVVVSGTGGEGDISVTRNASWASATGNDADNALGIAAGTGIDGASAAIASMQHNLNATIGANNDTVVAVQAAGGGGPLAQTGQVVLARNVLGASATGNVAGNQIDLDTDTGIQSTADGLAFIVSNNQASLDGSVNAEGTGSLWANLQNAEDEPANVALTRNVVVSRASVNEADNGLQATAGSASFTAAVMNVQFSGTDAKSTTESPGIQAQLAENSGADTPSNAVVDRNTLSSAASGNLADNDLDVTVDTTLAIPESGQQDINRQDIINRQHVTGAEISAETLGGDNGPLVGIVAAGGVTGTSDVLGNEIRSTALGSQADNALALAGGNLALDGDVSLENTQSTNMKPGGTPGVVEDGVLVSASTAGQVMIVAPTGNIAGSSHLLDNLLQSSAIANAADNSLSLAADTVLAFGDGAAATITNNQGPVDDAPNNGVYTPVTVNAATEGGLAILALGGDILGDATVSGNRIEATGGQNTATNILAAQAGSIQGGDLEVINQQNALGSVTVATTGTSLLGVQASGALPDAAVLDNVTRSVAFGNDATNGVTIDTDTGNGASASVSNVQDNASTVMASTTTAGVGTGSASLADGSVLTVKGNQVLASAYGNSASNALNATGAAGIMGDFSSSSTQHNLAAISSSVAGPTTPVVGGFSPGIGVFTSAASDGYTANVLNNAVASVAYGNTAYNSLSASSTVGMLPTTATLVSAQMNTGDITASVNNMGIGVAAGPGTAVIGGNTIMATAVGNASVSHITLGN